MTVDPSCLPPLGIAIPLAGACVLLALAKFAPRVVVDTVAMTTAVVSVAAMALLVAATSSGRVVTWVGGWTPKDGSGVGIVLAADEIGAGFALLACALTACALIYTWRYFDDAEAHVHVLILLFLAGMVGFSLTADLFDLFVFLELMSATAYALTGHKIEEPRSVQGGFTFGVVTSLGAYFSLTGIGILYARTGRLGMPQIGAALDGHGLDPLVLAALVLVLTGLLVKAAIVPFHFWLADAHAVAPTPVCVLFSGVMAPLGLYGVLRVSTTVFGGVLPAASLHGTLVVLGIATAALGATLCLMQRHLKRMLAYSTIAHLGLFLIGLATLTASGVAGAVLYVFGHAGVKGALFLMVGVLLARKGSVDEFDLHCQGRDARLTKWLLPLGALALAGLPPFGTGLGKAISEESSGLTALFVLVSAATGGAVLRASLRIHFGLGPPPQDTDSDTTTGDDEKQEGRFPQRLPATMVVAITVLLTGGLLVGVVPAVADALGAGRSASWTEPGCWPRPCTAPRPRRSAASTWSGRGRASRWGLAQRPPEGRRVANWAITYPSHRGP
ncbi:complex I subunit 5 family protein [Kutzneria sp. 744]|uniref:complex I subunit 5 family protein n=1 Tax=Kutzneria sp. (strain 744) TaxID=345341 RepID=UPI0003EEC26F|nr:complex I subunit 5 family protein [Kutzneria sp. 744]EWM10755.1 NADH-dehydrogenase [Kutzneria sp. 744]